MVKHGIHEIIILQQVVGNLIYIYLLNSYLISMKYIIKMNRFF